MRFLFSLLICFALAYTKGNGSTLPYGPGGSEAEPPDITVIGKQRQKSETSFISKTPMDTPLWIKVDRPEYAHYLSMKHTPYNRCTLYAKNSEGETIGEGKCSKYSKNTVSDILYIEDQNISSLYLKIEGFGMMKLSLKWIDADEAMSILSKEQFFNGLFFGIMILLILYNFVIYVQTKFPFLKYYLVYIAGTIVYFYVWQDILAIPVDIGDHIFWEEFGVLLVWSGLILFASSLLGIEKRYPGFKKNIRYALFAIIGLEIASLTSIAWRQADLYNILILISTVLIFAVSSAILFISAKLALKKDFSSIYFTIVWGILLGGILYNTYYYFKDSDQIFFSNIVLMKLVLLEAVAFSFVIAFRIRELQKEAAEYRKIEAQKQHIENTGFMLDAIAHQWRQPLNAINGIIFEYILTAEDPKSDKSLQSFNKIEALTQYLSQTIEVFESESFITKSDQKFQLYGALIDTINILEASLAAKNIKIRYDESSLQKISIVGSKTLFVHTLIILINNTIEAFDTLSEDKYLQFKSESEDAELHIIIEDNAGGIEAKILDTLFRDPQTTKPGHRGLGLIIADKIITEHFQGKIVLENSETGTRCTIKVPYDL